MSIEGFRPKEYVSDVQSVLLETFREALRQLRNRAGYGLLREDDHEIAASVMKRLVDHAECCQLAMHARDDDEQRKTLRKKVTQITQNVYSGFLYDSITATGQPVQREAYQELGRYFHQVAFNYFSGRHYAALRAQMSAEDCAQEALLKVFQHSKQVREAGSFLGWARTILVHVCAHAMRDDIERPEVNESNLVALDHEDEQVSSFLERMIAADTFAEVDLLDCCLIAFKRLPASNYRQVMILTYVGGLDDDEIARILGMTKANVQQYRSRARRYLRADEEFRACLLT